MPIENKRNTKECSQAENSKREHELSAVDLQPSTDKSEIQDIKLYVQEKAR